MSCRSAPGRLRRCPPALGGGARNRSSRPRPLPPGKVATTQPPCRRRHRRSSGPVVRWAPQHPHLSQPSAQLPANGEEAFGPGLLLKALANLIEQSILMRFNLAARGIVPFPGGRPPFLHTTDVALNRKLL